MVNYREWYVHYEDTTLHAGIKEVTTAEAELTALLENIEDIDLKDALDEIAGKLARAYEMQGFNMGYDAANGRQAAMTA